MTRTRHNIELRDEHWQALQQAARRRDTNVTALLDRFIPWGLELLEAMEVSGTVVVIRRDGQETQLRFA